MALRRIAVCVRLSFLAMVAISFEASIDDRSSSSSSGVHKKLRGTVIFAFSPLDKPADGCRLKHFHSFSPGGITEVACSDKDRVSVVVVGPLSSEPYAVTSP